MHQKLKENLKLVRERNKYFQDFEEFLFAPFIKIIVGARRVGKSFYLFQVIQRLLNENTFQEKDIFYINKEWLDFDKIGDYRDLEDYFQEWRSENKIGTKFFIGIDEIQEIRDWQKWVLSTWSSFPKSIICITGSNSHLLSRDLGTKLRGRYISKKIFPLSLREFSNFHKRDISQDVFMQYIQDGGLPAVAFIGDTNIKNEYLKGVYNTIFVKDLIEYESIRNPQLLKNIHKFLFKEFGNLINSKNISLFLKKESQKASVETILNYMNFSFHSYLFDEVLRYDIRGKKIFEVTKKIYPFDMGIRNAIVGIDLKTDIGGIYETIIYQHLISNGYTVTVGVLGEREIDFIAQKNEETQYIQVCYILSSEKVIDREFGNLLSLKTGGKKIVISGDTFPTTSYEGIEHKNIISWLGEMQ
ncbi:ATP-binding protein [Candidatus Gracilibacteria bacterium]|nr:ATP-binding protein [Candidatus Gracilibacteria bacterium]